MTQRVLIQDQTTTGKGPVIASGDATGMTQRRSFQASVEGTGAVTATVRIYGCNDARYPIAIGDITLNGTNSNSDAFVDDFPWEFHQAEVLAISGTNAKVSVFASV